MKFFKIVLFKIVVFPPNIKIVIFKLHVKISTGVDFENTRTDHKKSAAVNKGLTVTKVKEQNDQKIAILNKKYVILKKYNEFRNKTHTES